MPPGRIVCKLPVLSRVEVRCPLPEELLSLSGVEKRYGERLALRGVSFSIARGEAVGYLGPNGAGKTTTLKMLAGLGRPSAGSVRVFGQDPERARAPFRRIGVLHETPGLVPYVHGADLLDHVARVKHVPSAERAEHVRRIADALGISEQLTRPIGALSTGLQRRLLLGGALVGDPELLLLDEPTLGLDPAARGDFRRLLKSQRNEGRTILLSTHLLEDVAEVCGRVLFLRDGRLVGDEPVDLPTVDAQGRRIRELTLHFAQDLPPLPWAFLTSAADSVERAGPREVRVRLADDDRAQAAVIAAVVGAGLSLLQATLSTPGLAVRYLEKVGREDGE